MTQEIVLRPRALAILGAVACVGVAGFVALNVRDGGLLFMLLACCAIPTLFCLGYPCTLVLDGQGARLKWLFGSAHLGSRADIHAIQVTREVRGSGKNRRTVYPVRIDTASKRHEAGAPGQYLSARRLSEKLAVALEVPILDGGEGEVQERDFRTVNARWLDTARPADGFLPPPPFGLTLRSHAPTLVVKLPAPHWLFWFAGLALCVFLGWVAYSIGGEPLYAALAVALGLAATAMVSLPATLEASPGHLRVRYPLYVQRIDLERLEEVRCDLGSGLLFLEDYAIHRVNSNLDLEQGDWLKEAMLRALR